MRSSLLLLALLPLLASTDAQGATCLTRNEARKVYRDTHLYWSVGQNGRCWGNSLAAARAMAKGNAPKPRPLLPVVRAPLAVPDVSDLMPRLQISPIEWRWPKEE